jgi:uncharacterized protein DUF3883
MKTTYLGATHFSKDLFKIRNEFRLRHYDIFYLIEQNGQKSIIIANELDGYVEVSFNFLQELKDNLSDNSSQIDTAILKYDAKYLLQFPINEDSLLNHELRGGSDAHELLLSSIAKQVKRAARFMYHRLYQTCFFSFNYPKVYLTRDGFTMKNIEDVFKQSFRTVRDNLNKLKSIGLIDFNYSKNTLFQLRFNLEKFPLHKEKIPSIFISAFYNESKLIDYKSINDSLKELPDELLVYTRKTKNKVDYVDKQKSNIEIGKESEKKAFDFEVQRLISIGISKPENCVKNVSDNTSLGYDIISIENEEREARHIEVKTVKRIDGLYTFYLTDNELEKSQYLSNYFIYLVIYEANSVDVKILSVENMIKSKYFRVVPINYKVSINY